MTNAVQPPSWIRAEVSAGAARTVPPDVSRLLPWAWAASSGLLLLATGAAAARLHRRRTRWAHQTLGGVAVLVSDDVGPAVVGLLQPRIVVPRWIVGAGAQ